MTAPHWTTLRMLWAVSAEFHGIRHEHKLCSQIAKAEETFNKSSNIAYDGLSLDNWSHKSNWKMGMDRTPCADPPLGYFGIHAISYLYATHTYRYRSCHCSFRACSAGLPLPKVEIIVKAGLLPGAGRK